MNSIVSKVLIGLVLFAVGAWFVHDKLRDSRAARTGEKQRAVQEQRSRDAVMLASRRYGAIADWDEKFTNSMCEPFSLEIQDAIMPEGGKAIVLDGVLEDVERHDGKYFLHVSDWRIVSFSLRFILECDAPTARRLTQKKRDFMKVILVGQIDSVQKALVAIRSGLATTEDPAPVEIDSSTLFLARGRFIEILAGGD